MSHEGAKEQRQKPGLAPIRPLRFGVFVVKSTMGRLRFRLSDFGLRISFGYRISDFGPSAPRGPAHWSLDNGRVPPLIFFDFIFAHIEDSDRTIDVGHVFRVWLVDF
jgi:hypothetical protein